MLERETEGELNLALPVQGAAGFVDRPKGRVVVQIRTAQRIHAVADAGELRPVQDVERLGQELDVHLLPNPETPGKTEIQVPNRRTGIGIPFRQREVEKAVRTR